MPEAQKPWEGLPPHAFDPMTPHLPALAEEIIATIAAEVPAYARPMEGGFGAAMRLGVEEALARFGDLIRGGASADGATDVYRALGRGEVRQGRSLEALLAAYRVGARVAWRRVATVGLDAGLAPETLVLFAEAIFAYIDELSAESAEGFAREQAEQAGEADRLRAELLEVVLRVPAADPAAVAEAALAAGWPPPRELAVVAWPADRGRRPVARLPLGSLSAPFAGGMCALVPGPRAPGGRRELLAALGTTAAGIGPAVAPADAGTSFRRAVAALALAQERDAPAPLVADEHRVALLLRADPGLAAEIGDDALAPLAGETPASRRRLSETLLAWLRHDGNAAAAARELEVHVQTVRYRVARLRELFGARLEEPDGRFALEVALRASRPV